MFAKKISNYDYSVNNEFLLVTHSNHENQADEYVIM